MARRVGGDGANGAIIFKRKNVISLSLIFLFLQIMCFLLNHILEKDKF